MSDLGFWLLIFAIMAGAIWADRDVFITPFYGRRKK